MSRAANRTQTGVRFAGDLHARLQTAAGQHGVTVNWLVNKACADFLDRLLPPEEIVWTRDTPHTASREARHRQQPDDLLPRITTTGDEHETNLSATVPVAVHGVGARSGVDR